eukprot:6981850-Pyramimonas_sp.AAC.1
MGSGMLGPHALHDEALRCRSAFFRRARAVLSRCHRLSTVASRLLLRVSRHIPLRPPHRNRPPTIGGEVELSSGGAA